MIYSSKEQLKVLVDEEYTWSAYHMALMADTSEGWFVNCSDDENEDQRIVNGSKVWEPEGDKIAQLYSEIEKKGFIDLKWTCPGRRSPSINSTAHSSEKKSSDPNDGNIKSNEPNEFDFDEDIFDVPAKVSAPRRRSNQGTASDDECFNDD